MFKPADYIARFLQNPGQNDATKYGVSIQPATAIPDRLNFRVIGIHHLTGLENHGQHHAFCDILDEQGNRINGARINILTHGKPRGFMVIDKPASEAGTNTQMHWEDTLTLFVAGDVPGEKVTGLHTRHEDEEVGTTRGHHSFYIVWQRQQQPGPDPDPEPDPEPAPGDWRLHFDIGEMWLIEKCRKRPNGPFTELIAKMAGVLDVISQRD